MLRNAIWRTGSRLFFAVMLVAALVAAPAAAVAAAPTGAPTPTSPTAGSTVTSTPTFTWSAVSGGVFYHVQVSQSAVFGSSLYDVTTYQLKATPTSELPLGTLYWRAAAQDGSGAQGPWSTVVQFTKAWTAAPTLVAPSPISSNPATPATVNFPANPTLFSWTPLAGAASYQLEIDDATSFATPLISATTKLTSYTVNDPQAYGNTYYWHVRGVSPTGLYSAWSTTAVYTTSWPSTPVLTGPPNDTSGLTPVTDLTFSWNPVAGARSYELQVSPNGDWQNNRVLDVEVLSVRYSPPTTLNNASYFWRVRARDAMGNYGSWSGAWSFTRAWPGRPTLLGGLVGLNSYDIKSVQVPTFRWTPVQRADRYLLEIGTDPNFSPGTYWDCYTNHTQFTPYDESACFPQTSGQVYYWHVRGIDDGSGTLGLWSNTSDTDLGAFNIIPTQITQTAPSDGSTVSEPVLVWDAMDGANIYQVTILDKNQSVVATASTYATTYTPLGALNAATGPFSWYVQWTDRAGHQSLIPPQPSWWTFSLTAPSSTVAAPTTLIAPTSGSFTRMPSMTWQPVTGASYYKVYWIQGGVEHPLSGNLPYAAFTSTDGTLPAGVYAWWVRAYDSGNALLGGGPSAMGSFTITPPGVLGSGEYNTPARCALPAPCTPVRDTPTFTWNASPGASSYTIYIALDPNFTNIVKTYHTSRTTLTPTESFLDNQAGQSYYWFVRPSLYLGSRFDSGVFGNASAFQKRSAPVTTSTAYGVGRVSFSWTPYLTTSGGQTPPVTQEAKAYRIQVATAADFNTIIDDQTVDQTSYSPYATTYPIGVQLYWRVQAIDGSDNLLTSSATGTVTRTLWSAAPQPTSPANGASSSGTPYLSWSAADFAASYEVEVYRNGDTLFSSVNRVYDIGTHMLAWASSDPLPGGAYAWRVRMLDAVGRPGPWSGGRTFTITGAPALLSPASGATRTTSGLLFTWGAVSGAVSYNLQLSPTSDFASTPISLVTVMNQWAPTTRPADGQWYWRVRSLDANGNVVGTSAPWSLKLDSVAPTVTITPASAPSITGTFTATFSEPVTGISGSTFKMVFAGTTTAIGATVLPVATTATTTATLKPTAPLVPGRSYTISVSGAIVDGAGNAVVATSVTERTSLTVENGSVALAEGWQRVANASASGGAYAQSRQAGSTETLAVSSPGTVVIYGTRTSSGGYADVYLDGVKKNATPVSFYNASTQYKVAVYTLSSVPAGAHTITLKVLGTKAAASAGTWVYVDDFIAGGVTYEETAAQVTGRFATVASTSASGGSYDVATRTYGDAGKPSYAMTFYGTGVVVYGTKTATSGVAAIYVDGVLKASAVSFYAATTTYKAAVWTSAALTAGTHTLQILVTGATASGSTKTNVAVDWVAIK